MAGKRVLVVDDSPTILKVVQLVLTKAGYQVEVATDGEEGLRLAAAERPALILLDFVMPRMNGYQVCRRLSESAELADVPVVLMSAKAAQVGERFVKTFGVVDFISKPFSPDAIAAVVDHTIAKFQGHAERPTTAETDPSAMEHESTAPQPIEALRRRKAALEQLRNALAEQLGNGEPSPQVIDLTDEALEEILVSLGPTHPPGVVLSGDLAAVPLGEVLHLLQQQQQTGILTIQRDEERVETCFRRGRVEFAGSVGLGEEFFLGRYLLAQETISRERLDEFLDSQGGSARLIGEQLVKLNYISTDDLRQALSMQTCERIYESLRWAGGRFSFRATADLGPLAEGALLGLSVDTILMEGIRRVDEWHLIEREIDDFEAVFLRNEEAVRELGKSRLTREEVVVLELVSGKNTVKDIVRQSRLTSYEVSKMLFRLRSIQLIRRRVAPVAV